MIFKRGTLQKSGREVLKEGIFENKNIISLLNYATHRDLFSHVLLFIIVLHVFTSLLGGVPLCIP